MIHSAERNKWKEFTKLNEIEKCATYWYLSCVICNLKMGVFRLRLLPASITALYGPLHTLEYAIFFLIVIWKEPTRLLVQRVFLSRFIGRGSCNNWSPQPLRALLWSLAIPDYEMSFDYSIEIICALPMPVRVVSLQINDLNLINSKNESLDLPCSLLALHSCLAIVSAGNAKSWIVAKWERSWFPRKMY